MMQGRNVAANMDQVMKQVYHDPEVQAFLNQHQAQLNKESIRRGRSKLYEFFREKQLIKAGKATVAPGYSPQLQLVAGQIDVTYVPTQQLIERSHAIAEMALTCSPAWSFDGLTALCADLGRLLDFGDSTFKHNFVLILRHITAAQERHDMTALADLLSFEVPALLRSLLKSYTQLNAPDGKSPASKKQSTKA